MICNDLMGPVAETENLIPRVTASTTKFISQIDIWKKKQGFVCRLLVSVYISYIQVRKKKTSWK